MIAKFNRNYIQLKKLSRLCYTGCSQIQVKSLFSQVENIR